MWWYAVSCFILAVSLVPLAVRPYRLFRIALSMDVPARGYLIECLLMVTCIFTFVSQGIVECREVF